MCSSSIAPTSGPDRKMSSALPSVADQRDGVAVVIVSYYTGPVLERSIMSCLAQPEVAEVILVDNGNWPSAFEGVRAVVGDKYNRIKIISGHGNIGFAAGCNKGVRIATASHVVLLNPDAILPDGAVATLLDESRDLYDLWALGGRITGRDGVEQTGSRRRMVTPWSAFVEMTRLDLFVPHHPHFQRFKAHKDPCPSQLTVMPVISGACMFMTRATYETIGGLDEKYFLHAEDIDFCFRMYQAGGSIYYTPKVTIVHYKGSSRAGRIRIELQKARSLNRYFRIHFTALYPRAFLLLVCWLVWLGFCLRAVAIIAHRFFSFARFAIRHPKLTRAWHLSGKDAKR